MLWATMQQMLICISPSPHEKKCLLHFFVGKPYLHFLSFWYVYHTLDLWQGDSCCAPSPSSPGYSHSVVSRQPPSLNPVSADSVSQCSLECPHFKLFWVDPLSPEYVAWMVLSGKSLFACSGTHAMGSPPVVYCTQSSARFFPSHDKHLVFHSQCQILQLRIPPTLCLFVFFSMKILGWWWAVWRQRYIVGSTRKVQSLGLPIYLNNKIKLVLIKWRMNSVWESGKSSWFTGHGLWRKENLLVLELKVI